MSAAISESVEAMRGLGFFAGLDAEQALAKARAKMDEEWGEEEMEREPAGRTLDFQVLSADDESACWRDAECDAMEGNRAYVDWAQRLADASRGALALGAVREAWLPGAPGEPRVQVTLETLGRREVVLARDYGDYLDVDALVAGMNALLQDVEARYLLAETGDQMAFVVFADARQRQGLEARGWKFHGSAVPIPAPVPAPTPLPAPRQKGALARWWDAFWWPFRR